MNPVLFLDIDGVLNSESWYRRRPSPKKDWHELMEFDPEAVFLLRAVVALTSCEIVVSSSWRIGRSIKALQDLMPGLPIIDKTEILTTGHSRGAEIDLWLKSHPERTCFACVDDDSDIYEHQNHVQTQWKVGLTPATAEQLVRHLSSVVREPAE